MYLFGDEFMALRHAFFIAVFLCVAGFFAAPANAMPFEVTNIQMTAQSTDAVKAREMALAQAQRKAFAVLVGLDEAGIETVTDAQIARLVRGFSVRGERLAARAYTANFTIRFNPNATIGFVQQNGYAFAHAGQNGPIDANPSARTLQQAQHPDQDMGQAENTDPNAQNTVSDLERTLVILPVLDVGQQNLLWADPNPWREIWQAKDYSEHGLNIRVPLGDIADVTDVPDVGFMNGAHYNFISLLNRYAAGNAYIIVFKNQGSGGALLSLYRHDGSRLVFVRKMIANPRPGYRFDDAVPAALQMVIMTHNNNAGTSEPVQNNNIQEQHSSASDMAATGIHNNQPFEATIPYQSLQQWVAIQNRLRRVSGVVSVVPLRVSPSSAKVRLTANIDNMGDFQRSLAAQNFDLQHLPTGEIVLIEQFR